MLTTTDVIDRMLDPFAAAFTGDTARRISELRYDADVVAFFEQMGDLASAGQLTPEQKRDFEHVLVISDVLSILRLRAREAAAIAVSVA